MAGSNSLLLRLRSYRPREGRDSLEDFVTESFAWLLQQYPDVARVVLGKVYSLLGPDLPLDNDIEQLEWKTQLTIGGKRPDMVCDLGPEVLMFEHKVWSGLGDEQLANYEAAGNTRWPGKAIRLITITAHTGQFSSRAHVRLLWQDIHQLLSRLAESPAISADRHLQFHLADFLQLLEFEGLGPSDPVSMASVRCYRVGRALEGQLLALFKSLVALDWNLPEGYEVHVRNKEGRLGLQFQRTVNGYRWSPGIFVGCMLDGSDHCVNHRATPLVDFRVIFDFSRTLHAQYPALESYKALKAHLADRLQNGEWTFYDHLEDATVRSPNRWHPLHLERSFVDLLRGASSLDEQVKVVGEVITEVLRLVQEGDHLHRLMSESDLIRLAEKH
jgi:hypothetical protein